MKSLGLQPHGATCAQHSEEHFAHHHPTTIKQCGVAQTKREAATFSLMTPVDKRPKCSNRHVLDSGCAQC